MSVYQLRTYDDIVDAVREQLQIPSTDTTAIARIKRDINIIYQEVTAEKNWWWLKGNVDIALPAFIDTGTVSVTAASAAITFSSAPSMSQAGRTFAVDGFEEIYTIESHTAGATAAKLTEVFNGTTDTVATYKLWSDKVPLPTDCKETTEIWHDFCATPMEGKGLGEFRRIRATSPRREEKPSCYSTSDFIDPSPTSSIASLSATSTRSSAGVVKTIVFASTLPAAVTTAFDAGAPLRWRISGAASPSYNGDIVVSSASGSTITYTGKVELQESSTSDTSITVTQLDTEADYDRYRALYVWPALVDTRLALHVDYIKEIFPLENDSDEPAMPIQDRAVLLYGALFLAYGRTSDEESVTKYYGLYTTKLAKMAGKHTDSLEMPSLAPSKLYLAAKRNPRRYQED